MKRILFFMLASSVSMMPASQADALSRAARYLVHEQVKASCNGEGTFGATGIIERDISGDGKPDLILDLAAISCKDGNRSNQCGTRACSVYLYIREGKLLQLKLEVLSAGVTVADGSPPSVKLVGHNFEQSSIQWNGSEFR